jgi:hypothetical protein
MIKDKKNSIVLTLLLLNIIATLVLTGLFSLHMNSHNDIAINSNFTPKLIDYSSSQKGKYTLYIGTNDKDTYIQEISTEDAKNIINSICVEYVGGYTSQEATGGWIDETNTLTMENTLIYHFYDVTEDQIISIMNDVLIKLNQKSILIEAQDVNYTYYYGDQVGGVQ